MISYHRLALGTAILAIAGALGGILFATGSGAPLDGRVFPDRITTRVEVSRGEEIRTVELYPDLITAKHALATHKDGSVTNYWYRADRTLERAITDGPEAADGKRSRLRYAEVAPDGITYVLDVEYLADGKKSKETRIIGDGKVTRTYFHSNGIARRVQELAHEKQGWKLVQEDQFREDNSLSLTMRTAKSGAVERKFFNDAGVLTSSKTLGPYGLTYAEVTYQSDGVTRATQLDQNGQRTILTTYRANGSRSEERTWSGAVGSSSIRVMRFDWQDRQQLQQWWSYNGKDHSLWLVKVYRPDDKSSLWKTVYFERDSAKTTELIFDGDGEYVPTFTRREYDKNGLLENEERVVRTTVVSGTKFAPPKDIRLQLPADYTVMTDIPTPPQVIPYTPAAMGGP